MECYKKAAIDSYERADRDECKCLPSCMTLTYEGYQTSADYDLVPTLSKGISHEGVSLEK